METTVTFPHAPQLASSRLALGCMKFGQAGVAKQSPESLQRTERAAETAIELGWNFFDHADIYAGGQSESVFGDWWTKRGIPRQQFILQTKCGIRFAGDPYGSTAHRYDFSKAHIIAAATGSLQRLRTDYVDILLLHRPDLLAEPEECLAACEALRQQGKIRYFGVSNFTPAWLAMFAAAGFHPVANQVEINVLKTSLIDSAIVSDSGKPSPGHPADGTLEYHRSHGIVTQAWAPLAYGYPVGRQPDWDPERVHQLAKVIADIANDHGVAREAIVIAWLLRHPAKIQPIIGSGDPDRLRACHAALSVNLSREDWYRITIAGRGRALP